MHRRSNMANNYETATVYPYLPLTDVQRLVLRNRVLEDLLEDEGYHALSDDDKETALNLRELWDDYYSGTDPDGESFDISIEYVSGPTYRYYLYTEYGSGGGGLELILQDILRGLSPEEYPYITVEAAMWCSKVRPGEFGGWAAFITRQEIECSGTGSWLDSRTRRWMKEGHPHQEGGAKQD
jgi:hypothetical protein